MPDEKKTTGMREATTRREPWPEGWFALVCRGAYPVYWPKGHRPATRLVFDGMRLDAKEKMFDYPTLQFNGHPGDAEFEQVRVEVFGGPVKAPDGDRFAGFKGRVIYAQIFHRTPEGSNFAYANIGQPFHIVESDEDFEATTGLSQDAFAKQMTSQTYYEDSRNLKALDNWRMNPDGGGEQPEPDIERPRRGSAPGIA